MTTIENSIGTKFADVQVLNEGLVAIKRNGERMLWSARSLRKPGKCAACQSVLPTGTEAFGPIGNPQYRYERLCRPCVRKLQ